MAREFTERIATVAELEAVVGQPADLVIQKQKDSVDKHTRDFIARSSLLLLGTANKDGWCDVSPRGDAPGFVQVLDEKTLVIPERPGNRRADSLRNILENPRVGLLFVVPGRTETLRVNGQAYLIRDADMLASMARNGKPPLLGVTVTVEECYMHCVRALLRAEIWQSEKWVDPAQMATLAQVIADQTGFDACSVAELQAAYEEANKTLY